jgi:hypothetical protein
MKVTIEVECTPAEARAFLGLPDVTPLNDHLISEMTKRMDANVAMMQPEEIMKAWTGFGLNAQEQFRQLMTAAAGGGLGGFGGTKPGG